MAFFGEFDHKIDPKGRVNLPAQYREAFRDGGFISYLPPRLALFTAEGWAEYQEKITGSGALTREELQLIMGLTTEFVPDAQNRIIINAKTRQLGGLHETVTVVGTQSYLSIWDRDEWAANKERLLRKPESGKSLAEKFSELDFV